MNRLQFTLLLLVVLVLPVRAAPGEELRMNLRQALERALLAAPEIREGRYGPPIAGTFVAEAQGEFDHLLSFSAAGSRIVRPTATFFDEGTRTKEQRFAGLISIGQKIRTGGSWSFGFQTNDFLTDNRFYVVRPQWSNALSFRVDQPLLRTAGTDYNLTTTRLAEAGERKARHIYAGVLNSTLAAVERAYWRLAFARADLEVKQKSVEVSEELLRISERRLDAGAGTRVDVVQADAGLAEREKELILSEAAAKQAQDRLRAFLYPFSDNPDRELTIIPIEKVGEPRDDAEGTLPNRLAMAFDHRPDLLALKEDLVAIGLQVIRAENEVLPRLDFFGSAGLAALEDDFFDSTGSIFSGKYTDWELGLALEIPIGNFAANARERRAVLERSRYIAAFDTLTNQVVLELRTVMRNVDTSRREIRATRRAKAAADAQFDAEVDRVKAEKSTNYRLLQTEQDRARARSQVLLALVAYRVSIVDLEAASGTYLAYRGLAAPLPATREEAEAETGEEADADKGEEQ